MNEKKYMVRRIDRTKNDGTVERKQVCIETDDIEAFRKKMKGSRYADVNLVYEEVG